MSNIKVFIMRGLPGSGKSTYIKNKRAELAAAYPGIEQVIVSADHHFMSCSHVVSADSFLVSSWSQSMVEIAQSQHASQCPEAKYVFDGTKLSKAHGNCQINFINLLDQNEPCFIFVDNTNLALRDVKFYAGACIGHNVEFVIVNVRTERATCAMRNVHGVPAEVYPQLHAKMNHGDDELAKLDWPQVEYYT